MRAVVLSTYRSLLRYASLLSTTQNKEQSLLLIKNGFRENRLENDPIKLEELLKKAESSLGYLKIITPRKSSHPQQGYTKIVFGDADKAKRAGRAVTNWTGKNMDPDSVKRHYQGLKRAGYKNNAHAKGNF